MKTLLITLLSMAFALPVSADEKKPEIIQVIFQDQVNDVHFSMTENGAMVETPISADGKRAYYLACIPYRKTGSSLAVLRYESISRDNSGDVVFGSGKTIATALDSFIPCAFKAAKLKGASVQPRTITVKVIAKLLTVIEVQ